MVGLVAYGVNLLWLSLVYARADRRSQRPAELTVAMADWPRVTVQIPLYNEALVVRRVIDACARLRYDPERIQFQVLDDSTDETTRMAEAAVAHWQDRGVSIELHHRDHRTGYKAGALQSGLRSATGELIAIFDADFVPPADFLLRVVPGFQDAAVGMIQARWAHLNPHYSLLTRIQSCGLDAHFAVEHVARAAAGCFINFNGTAGVWRRRCIEDAGGWEGDTLAEDVDLSYRAQLKGWQFRYLHALQVPAELPTTLGALRAQQFRWTKGTTEVARKLMVRLWRSGQSIGRKVQATVHLTAHAVYPCLLVAAVLHPAILLLDVYGYGPGDLYFACMGLGLMGLLGFFLAQLLAQRALYADWARRMRFFPVFVAGSMGMAVSNTHAVWAALRRKHVPFARTPKSVGRYATRNGRGHSGIEAGLAVYSLFGLGVIVWAGLWAASAFQALFAAAFSLLSWYNIRESQ